MFLFQFPAFLTQVPWEDELLILENSHYFPLFAAGYIYIYEHPATINQIRYHFGVCVCLSCMFLIPQPLAKRTWVRLGPGAGASAWYRPTYSMLKNFTYLHRSMYTYTHYLYVCMNRISFLKGGLPILYKLNIKSSLYITIFINNLTGKKEIFKFACRNRLFSFQWLHLVFISSIPIISSFCHKYMVQWIAVHIYHCMSILVYYFIGLYWYDSHMKEIAW